MRRPSNKHEVPSNPIRCAREHSVPKTACPAPRSRYSFEYYPSCGRKPGNPTDFATYRSFSKKLREPLASRVTGQGHRERRTPPSQCARSSRAIAGARLLGLRTHAQTVFRTVARLPAWKTLALSQGRNIGVGRLPLRGIACCLTCGLHLKMTQNKLGGPSRSLKREERWLVEVSSKACCSSEALEENFG